MTLTPPLPTDLDPVIRRLHRAWNDHDLDAVIACFHSDYESIHPCRPERGFRGQRGVRLCWGALLDSIPDFRADLRRCAASGNTVWCEWRWEGTHVDGFPFESVGVMIFDIEGDQIIRAHVYSEILQTDGPNWDSVLAALLEGETTRGH
ncbi:MAG: nuclear transport factor 2 family protein [Chloroflexi bacterium]|nr:nuclear transport factor 2 family protein [Chloroflexota bacterium]